MSATDFIPFATPVSPFTIPLLNVFIKSSVPGNFSLRPSNIPLNALLSIGFNVAPILPKLVNICFTLSIAGLNLPSICDLTLSHTPVITVFILFHALFTPLRNVSFVLYKLYKAVPMAAIIANQPILGTLPSADIKPAPKFLTALIGCIHATPIPLIAFTAIFAPDVATLPKAWKGCWNANANPSAAYIPIILIESKAPFTPEAIVVGNALILVNPSFSPSNAYIPPIRNVSNPLLSVLIGCNTPESIVEPKDLNFPPTDVTAVPILPKIGI